MALTFGYSLATCLIITNPLLTTRMPFKTSGNSSQQQRLFPPSSWLTGMQRLTNAGGMNKPLNWNAFRLKRTFFSYCLTTLRGRTRSMTSLLWLRLSRNVWCPHLCQPRHTPCPNLTSCFLQTTNWSPGKRLSSHHAPLGPNPLAATAKLADGRSILTVFKTASCTLPHPDVTGNGSASWRTHANTAARALNSRTRLSSNDFATFATALKMPTSEPPCRDTSLPRAVLNGLSGSKAFTPQLPPATLRQLPSSKQSKRPPVTGANLLPTQEANLRPFRMSEITSNKHLPQHPLTLEPQTAHHTLPHWRHTWPTLRRNPSLLKKFTKHLASSKWAKRPEPVACPTNSWWPWGMPKMDWHSYCGYSTACSFMDKCPRIFTSALLAWYPSPRAWPCHPKSGPSFCWKCCRSYMPASSCNALRRTGPLSIANLVLSAAASRSKRSLLHNTWSPWLLSQTRTLSLSNLTSKGHLTTCGMRAWQLSSPECRKLLVTKPCASWLCFWTRRYSFPSWTRTGTFTVQMGRRKAEVTQQASLPKPWTMQLAHWPLTGKQLVTSHFTRLCGCSCSSTISSFVSMAGGRPLNSYQHLWSAYPNWAWESTLPRAALWFAMQDTCPHHQHNLTTWNFCGDSLGYTTHNTFANHLDTIWMSMRYTNKPFNQFLLRGASWSLSYRKHTGHIRTWWSECWTNTLDRPSSGCLHSCTHTNILNTNCL